MATGGSLRRLSARVARQLRSSSYSSEPLAGGLSIVASKTVDNSPSEQLEGISSRSIQLGKPWTGVVSLGSEYNEKKSVLGHGQLVRHISGGLIGGKRQQVTESENTLSPLLHEPPAADSEVSQDGPSPAAENAVENAAENAAGNAESSGEEHSNPVQNFEETNGFQTNEGQQTPSKWELLRAAAEKKAKGLSVKDLNKTLSDLVSRGDHLEAKFLFEAWVAISGNEPSVLSYNFMLHAMVRLGDHHEELMKAVDAMEKRGLEPNMLSFNSLLRASFRERQPYHAETVLKRMESGGPKATPDADSYNLVVSVCALTRRIGAALLHMQDMMRRGFVPSKSTYNEVLAACARLRRSRDAVAVLKELKAQSIPPIPGTLGELLTSSVEAEDAECCLLVLQMTAERRLMVDQGTLLGALNLAARGGNPTLAEQAWALLKVNLQGKNTLPAFHLARIHTYAAAADFTSAFRSVREFEEAWETESTEPDLFSPFTSLRPLVLAVSRGVGVLDSAYYRLADMHTEREVVSLAAINCVIAGCSALRDTDRAQQTFDEVEKTFELTPDVHTYNALMDGYGKKGQADTSESLFNAMVAKGIAPNSFSYDRLASAFIMSHNASKAHSTVLAMVEAGHTPCRELLIHLYRRSLRADYSSGADFAARTIHEIGYRDANAGEVRRRSLLTDVTGVTHDPRPARRERAPAPVGERWQEDSQKREFQSW